jgi:hypothetical protein
MSTKTSIKRIAAVAAVALTLGGFSAVSAHAAARTAGNTIVYAWTGDGTALGVTGTSDATTGYGSATLNGVAGAVNTVEVFVAQKAGTQTAGTAFLGSASPTGATKRSIVTVSGSGATISAVAGTSGDATVNTAGTQATFIANNGGTLYNGAQYGNVVSIFTPTAGTVTVSLYKESSSAGIFSSTAAETVTITVAAAASSGTLSVANSTFYDTTTDAAATASLTTAPSLVKTAVNVASNTAGTATVGFGARYDWALKDTLSAPMASTTAWSVTVAGPGVLVAAGASPITPARVLSGTSALGTFYIYPDGTSGTATVTLSAGSTVIGTKSVTFTGTTVASIKTTAIQTNVALAAVAGYAPYSNTDLVTNATGTFSATAADSLGNAIALSANTLLTAKSSDTTIATVVAAGAWNATDKVSYFTVTGVAAGKATITVADAATGLITSTVAVTVSKAVATTITLTLDAASYGAGDKVTWTLTAKDSAGSPVADGVYTGFESAGSTNQSVPGGTLPGANVSFLGGVATGSFYAPSSTFTLTVKPAAVATVVTAAQSVALTASATVTNAAADAAQAAVDAANEATDAANAATDAANNAMDSADAAQQAALDAGDKADAALAAVTDLASKVADIATQISALSSLVSKIAASVAKISAKVKA